MAVSKMKIEFGAWEPDAAKLNGQQACEARNVVPGKRGYRCLNGLTEMQYAALTGQARAAFTLKDLDGSLVTLAATDGGIYALESAAWAAKYSGAAVSSGRSFAEYGNAIYALFGSTLLKSAISGSAGDFTAVTGAPSGEILGVIRDFLVVGRLASYKNGIQWSALDNPDSWPEPGSNAAQYAQSDRQIFPSGGNVMAIVGGVGGVDGLIFLERGIQRATYVGTPYFFQFDVVDRARGCAASASPVICGNICVYLADDGWRMTDGSSVKAIGAERIDEWFFDQCDSARIAEVRGVHDAENRLAVWSFPTQAADDGVHDRVLIYNYAIDKWSYGTITTETLFQDYSRGLTLEELDAYGSIDSLPFSSLDSAAMKNGRQGISAFTAGHKMARFGGDTLEAVLDTAEAGGERMLCHGLRPLVDRGDAQAAPVWRIRQQDAQIYGHATKQARDGVCYQHLSTNYLSARVLIPAGEAWRNAVGVEALIEPEGGM